MEFLFQNLFLYFSTWFGFGFGFDLGLGFTETFWFGFGFCQNRKSGFVRSLLQSILGLIIPKDDKWWPRPQKTAITLGGFQLRMM